MDVDIFNTDKKYSIIYADPPWQFSAWSSKAQKHVTAKYPTMTIQEIMDLPVKELAADNAVLFLWATFPNLPLAMKTIEAWGFTYKTCAFTWVKQCRKKPSLFWGMGYYTRSNAEVCLLATKGKPLPRASHKVHSVIVSPVEEHSKKPGEARDRIVQLFGDIPRIELFARQQAGGWDCWGNETDKFTQEEITMAITCCKGCVAPKRYPGCHGHCADYAAEKAEYDRLKTAEEKRRKVGNGIYSQRSNSVTRAIRKHGR